MIIEAETLSGYTLEEVVEKLDAPLHEDAYKAVRNAQYLTDISPAYRNEFFNKYFGLCGYGWGFSYDPSEFKVGQYKNHKGTLFHTAEIHSGEFWYKLIIDGEEKTITVQANGFHENPNGRGYAMKGAITNFLNQAASQLGWQLSVYKGLRSHTSKDYVDKEAEAEFGILEAAQLPFSPDQFVDRADDSLALTAQLMALRDADGYLSISEISSVLGEDATSRFRGSLSKLLSKAGKKFSYTEELFGKKMSEMTISDTLVFWQALNQLVNGVDEKTVKEMVRAVG